MNRRSLALAACLLTAPAIASAQTGGLTRVQLLALQQELKEQCGLAHTTGRMDGPTRHAIAVCNKKYGTHGNGAALLRAMNIGFDSGEMSSNGMGSVMGNRGGMSSGAMSRRGMPSDGMPNGMATPAASKKMGRSKATAQADSVLRSDRGGDSGNPGMTKKSDTTFSAQSDSLMRASRGIALPTMPKPKKKN